MFSVVLFKLRKDFLYVFREEAWQHRAADYRQL